MRLHRPRNRSRLSIGQKPVEGVAPVDQPRGWWRRTDGGMRTIHRARRRRLWRGRPPRPDSDAASRWRASNHGRDVEASADRRAFWSLLDDITQHELTPRQRLAVVGRIFAEKPLVVLADELGTDKDNV